MGASAQECVNRPLVIDNEGNVTQTGCFVAPEPEPPEGRMGSGSGNEFTNFAGWWCSINGNLWGETSPDPWDNIQVIRVCDVNQWRTLPSRWKTIR